MKNSAVKTSHCEIAITESVGTGPVLLMIHGNSSCKEIFKNQYRGAIGKSHHCIAMDLPGHGASEDAIDPGRTYSMPGYADAAIELMKSLGHANYVILGWSLGGHIGLEILARSKAVAGLMISGTPPVDKGGEGLAAGFLASDHMHLAGQLELSAREVEDLARSTCGESAPFEPFLSHAVARTDGRARENMVAAFQAGAGINQQEAAIHSSVPLAIVNGEKDAFVNNEFIASLRYDNLWEHKVHLLKDIGHAPFWEAPDLFDPILVRYMTALVL